MYIECKLPPASGKIQLNPIFAGGRNNGRRPAPLGGGSRNAFSLQWDRFCCGARAVEFRGKASIHGGPTLTTTPHIAPNRQAFLTLLVLYFIYPFGTTHLGDYIFSSLQVKKRQILLNPLVDNHPFSSPSLCCRRFFSLLLIWL